MNINLKMPTSVSLREDDPLLKDLSEKKQSFRRNVVSLATELKEARTRLAEQERSCSKQVMSRLVNKLSFVFLCFLMLRLLVIFVLVVFST